MLSVVEVPTGRGLTQNGGKYIPLTGAKLLITLRRSLLHPSPQSPPPGDRPSPSCLIEDLVRDFLRMADFRGRDWEVEECPDFGRTALHLLCTIFTDVEVYIGHIGHRTQSWPEKQVKPPQSDWPPHQDPKNSSLKCPRWRGSSWFVIRRADSCPWPHLHLPIAH